VRAAGRSGGAARQGPEGWQGLGRPVRLERVGTGAQGRERFVIPRARLVRGMRTMTEDVEDVVRRQSFEHEGAAEIDLGTGAGRIEVRLVDEPGVHVEVRHDPSGASPFAMGVSSLMSWINTQFGQGMEAPPSPAAEAVRQTRIDFTSGRLVVRTPKDMQLRN